MIENIATEIEALDKAIDTYIDKSVACSVELSKLALKPISFDRVDYVRELIKAEEKC